MPENEIDSLIGAAFVPLNKKKPVVQRNPFISGPPSRFVLERNLPSSFYESMALHHEARRVKKQKQEASLVTLTPTPAQKRLFYSRLDRTTASLRNFIISEVAVFELALSTAVQEASDLLEQITGSQVENLKMGRITKATEELVELHVMSKLAKTLGVNPEVRKTIMNGMAGHGKKDMPDMRKVLELLALRKGADQQMRGLDQAQTHEPERRSALGTRRVRS